VFLHVLADTLGSVGVIISTLLIQWVGWTGFDPLASIFISVLIFLSVLPLVTSSARILMQSITPQDEHALTRCFEEVSAFCLVNPPEILNATLSQVLHRPDILSYHSPQVWELSDSPRNFVGTVHVVVDPQLASPRTDITHQLEQQLKEAIKRHLPDVEKVELCVDVEYALP
jgi:zinc transporter 5/7